MSRHLVVVDPLWLDAAPDLPRSRSVRLTATRLERRRAHLGRIARACVESCEAASASRPPEFTRVWRSLAAPDPTTTHVDFGAELALLPALGAFVVGASTADVLRRAPLLGLHVVEETAPVPSGPFADDPSVDENWHVGAVRGRDAVDDGGEGAVVGILDTGIDASHPEFARTRIAYAAFGSDGSLASEVPRDFAMHGTHVAGIVAGATCGIAPKASLAVAAVMTPRGSAAAFASGLEWLLTGDFGRHGGAPGVDVINASVGFTCDEPRLRTMIRRALREHGTLTIAASGNDGASGPDRCSAPARFPETLAVGAVDRSRVVASFSAYGTIATGTRSRRSKPELSAPGVGIRSCVPGGRYRALSATSMASPMVAGAAAVLLSRNPALRGRPGALRAALLASVTSPSRAHPRFGNTGGAGVVSV